VNVDSYSLELSFLDAVPTALEPGVEVAFGKDPFRDMADIIPRQEQDLPPGLQGQESIGPVERGIADLVGASPYNVQHLIKGHTATLGNYALDLANLGATAGKPAPLPPEPPGQQLASLLGMRSRRPLGFGTTPVTELYRLSDRARQGAAGIKEHLEKGNVEGARSMRLQYPEASFEKYLQGRRRELARWRRLRREIFAHEAMTPAERQEALYQIDMVVTQIAASALEVVRQGNP